MSSYVGADCAVDSGGDDDGSQRRSRGFHRSKGLFGRLPRDESNGSEVEISYYAIGNSNGVSFTVINYGATIVSMTAPDRDNCSEEVTICFRTLDELVRNHGPYYGCVAGRVANRIKEGAFELDGCIYQLAVNNSCNHLHGGLKGFDQQVWTASEIDTANTAGVEFKYLSNNGEEHYPGNLQVAVRYELTRSNELIVTYLADTDQATPVNLTNHTYWNLSGGGRRKIYDSTLLLSCSRYLPVDETQIPTGQLVSVKASAEESVRGLALFDFTSEKILQSITLVDGGGASGLDHCFAVDGALHEDGSYKYDSLLQRSTYESVSTLHRMIDGPLLSHIGSTGYLRHVGTLTDPASGRRLDVHATQPGVQVYTANWLSNTSNTGDGDSPSPHTQHNAICLETQHFPDAVNQSRCNKNFPSVVVRPGEAPYFHQAVFTFSTC